jgi:tetratricopeptide (TPR) repeat protein
MTLNAAAQASIEASDVWPPNAATSSDEVRLLDDAHDGRFDHHSLLTAALVASGADDSEASKAQQTYQRLKAAVLQSMSPQDAPRDRAASLLRGLHQRALREGYNLSATAIHHCLATGRFNCVSATVLFNCLAAEIGLEVHTRGYPNHARSLLIADGQEIEIETTCADWFRRSPEGTSRDSDDLATAAHGEPRSLTDVALVAMIYYNRAVEASRDHDYQSAICLNRLALALDPDHSLARANLYSAINNHALAACRSEHFADAIALIRLGLSLNPQHQPFHDNVLYVYHSWLEHLASRHDINAALGVLEEAQRQAPSAPLWNNWRSRIAAHL